MKYQPQSFLDQSNLVLREAAEELRGPRLWVELNWTPAVALAVMRDQPVAKSPDDVVPSIQCGVMLKVEVEGIDVSRELEESAAKAIVIDLERHIGPF